MIQPVEQGNHDSSNFGERETQASRPTAALLVVLVLALAVRCIGFSSQSISMDEAIELEIAASPLQQLIHEANSFPPLYHLLLKVWTSVFDSLLASRILAVILGLLSIVVLYQLVGDLLGEKTGMVTATLAAISPFHVFYSQEGRSYMLYFLLAAWAIWSGMRFARDGSRLHGVIFVVAATLGAYTHYYFVMVLVATTVGAAAFYGLDRVPRFALVAAIIGILCIPTFFLLRGDLDFQKNLREPRPMNLVSVGYTFFSFASGYSLGPSRAALHTMETREALLKVAPWAALVGFGYGVPFLLGCMQLRRKLSFWGSLLAVPLLNIAILCSVLGLTYNPRFAVWLWIPFIAICAAGLGAIPKRHAAIFLAAILFVSGVAFANRNLADEFRNEDVHAVAEFLHKQDKHGVLVCAGYMAGPLELYLDDSFRLVRAMDPSHPDGSEEAVMLQLKRSDREFWFVYSREFHGDPEGRILKAILPYTNSLPAFKTAGIKVYRCSRDNQSFGRGDLTQDPISTSQ